MAPRRRLLLLLAVAAACCSLLAASPVHAGNSAAAEPTAVPRAVDNDDLLRGIQPYVRPIVVGGVSPFKPFPFSPFSGGATTDPDPGTTSYDVTVVFRATRRVGPPRLDYAVLPVADKKEEEMDTLSMFAIAFAMVAVFGLVLYGCSFLPALNPPTGDAIKKN